MKIDWTYTKSFLFLSGFLILLILLADAFFKNIVNPYVWYLFAYVAIITYSSHFITMMGFGKTPLDLQNFFMLGFSVRLLLSAIVLFIYFYRVKMHAWSFLIDFFIFYFSYTFFEIKTLLLSLQPHSKSGNGK